MSAFDFFRSSRRLRCPGADILCMSLDDAGRCGEPFNGSNSLLEPPSIFGRPIFEPPVYAEIVGPVLCDIGVELRLPTNSDEVRLPILQDRFSLLGFENDANRHRRNAYVLADPFGIGHLETEATRDLGSRRRARNAAGGAVDHVDTAGLQFPGECNGVIQIPTVRCAVNGGDAYEQWHRFR